jgi:hypothetical protein
MCDHQAGTTIGSGANNGTMSRGLSLARGIDGQRMKDTGPGIQIEFEHAWNHNDCLGPISVFEHCEPKSCCAVDEQATAKVLLVLNNPVA